MVKVIFLIIFTFIYEWDWVYVLIPISQFFFFLELPIYSFPYVSNKLNKLSTYKNSLYIKENSPFLSAPRL